MKYTRSIAMLLVAIFFGLVGLVLGLISEAEWFARFGSIIVLFGVASEYALFQTELSTLYRALIGQGATVAGGTGIPDLSPSKYHKLLALISHITIIIGTVIWGFGDRFLIFIGVNA